MWLLDKLGENNVRVRNKSEEALSMIIKHPAVGVNILVAHITKGQMKSSSYNSYRHVLGRVRLLEGIVRDFGIDNPAVPFEPVLEYALTALKNTKEDIRKHAYAIVMMTYKEIGRELKLYLSKVGKAQLAILEDGFQRIDSGQDVTDDAVTGIMHTGHAAAPSVFAKTGQKFHQGGSPGKTRQSQRSPPREEVVPNMHNTPRRVASKWSKKRGGETPSRTGGKKSEEKKEEMKADQDCPFCAKTGYTVEGLDHHFETECRMLTLCTFCE